MLTELKDKAVFFCWNWGWKKMGEQLKAGNTEKGETLWKRRDILRGKKEGEKMKRELLMCFTPTPPLQLHSNRGNVTIFYLTSALPGSCAWHRGSGKFFPFAF